MQTVGVLGAGLMGAGIAQVSVANGYRVLLKDEFMEGLAKGEAQIKASLDPKVKRRAMTAFDRDTLLSKVVGLTPDNGNWRKHFEKCDMVIEAVPENLDLKHRVVRLCLRLCVCAATPAHRCAPRATDQRPGTHPARTLRVCHQHVGVAHRGRRQGVQPP